MNEDFVAKALSSLRQKDFAAALEAIDAYAQDNIFEFQHYMIKGLAQLSLMEHEQAARTFGEAVRFFPHQPLLWFNLGIAQENLSLIDDAALSFEHSLELQSDQASAYGNLSNIYRRQGRFDEAEKMAHRAFELGAPKAQALNSLALALSKQGKFDAALTTLQQALGHDANNAEIYANLANLKVDQLKFDEAFSFFQRARTIHDSATLRRDEGMARLLAGDFARGWPLYEARLELPRALYITPPCPRYNGEPVPGKKIMLVAEQGFGDSIMFCRYGKYLAEQGAELIWLIPQALQSLLQNNMPGTIVVRENNIDAIPVADYYLPLLSLPLATGKLLPNDAPVAPYLKVAATAELPKAKEGKRKIGLVWAGSRTHERDHERSLLLDQFAPLFALKDVQLYALFKGDGLEEITDDTPVISLAGLLKDFASTAALLQQLDCLVTVDTAAAHLAGALGVKTILLVSFCPDWRWGTSGDTTPWYKNMTILRQPRYGDWDSVIQKAAEILA